MWERGFCRFAPMFPFLDYRLREVRWSRAMDGEVLFHLLDEHVRIQCPSGGGGRGSKCGDGEAWACGVQYGE